MCFQPPHLPRIAKLSLRDTRRPLPNGERCFGCCSVGKLPEDANAQHLSPLGRGRRRSKAESAGEGFFWFATNRAQLQNSHFRLVTPPSHCHKRPNPTDFSVGFGFRGTHTVSTAVSTTNKLYGLTH